MRIFPPTNGRPHPGPSAWYQRAFTPFDRHSDCRSSVKVIGQRKAQVVTLADDHCEGLWTDSNSVGKNRKLEDHTGFAYYCLMKQASTVYLDGPFA